MPFPQTKKKVEGKKEGEKEGRKKASKNNLKKRGQEMFYLEHNNKLRCNWDFCTSLLLYHYFLILCNSRRVSRSECLKLHSRDCFYSIYPFELKVFRMVELLYSKQWYAFLFSSIWTGFLCEKMTLFPRFKRLFCKKNDLWQYQTM